MAAQLTPARLRKAIGSDAPVLRLSARYLVALGIGCLILTYGSLIAAAMTSSGERDRANARYQDAVVLLGAPSIAMDDLKTRAETATQALATAEARRGTTSGDPDDVIPLLVLLAQKAGLRVTGIARLDATTSKTNDVLYDVEGVRMRVAASPATLIAFLASLNESHPTIIASLVAMNLTGDADAEIVFRQYRKVEPTPAAGAPPPRARR